MNITHSPWGAVQTQSTLATGIYNVTTAGHGGIMINASIAEKLLSKEAKERGEIYGKYYCYEEDCAWAIPTWEISALQEEANLKGFADSTFTTVRKIVMETLSNYYPEYLEERGELSKK